jgi:glycosyltransferase involved in cell wall biosynthesis
LVQETIDSVLKQTFQDFELLIVDDGSTDDTEEVLKSYGGRLCYLRQENRGASAARNLGVRHARASWISIQDSDDICAPNHLETLWSAVQRQPGVGMVFANGAYLDDPGPKGKTIIPRKISERLAEKGVTLTDLFATSIVRLQAALLSKQAFLEIGGLDEELQICMDLDLAFRLFQRFAVGYLDRVVFFYRRHEGNIGHDQQLRLLENIRVIEKLIQEFPPAAEILGWRRINQRKAYRYYRLAKARWQNGENEWGNAAIARAIALRPYFLKYRVYQLMQRFLNERQFTI